MRKLIGVAILFGIAANAAAEWKVIDQQDARVTYIEPSEIKLNGNIVRMWTMVDFKQKQTMPSGPRYSSNKTLWELDCKEGKIRMLQATAFSGKMGEGTVVWSGGDPAPQWDYVSPGSVNSLKYSVACKP